MKQLTFYLNDLKTAWMTFSIDCSVSYGLVNCTNCIYEYNAVDIELSGDDYKEFKYNWDDGTEIGAGINIGMTIGWAMYYSKQPFNYPCRTINTWIKPDYIDGNYPDYRTRDDYVFIAEHLLTLDSNFTWYAKSYQFNSVINVYNGYTLGKIVNDIYIGGDVVTLYPYAFDSLTFDDVVIVLNRIYKAYQYSCRNLNNLYVKTFEYCVQIGTEAFCNSNLKCDSTYTLDNGTVIDNAIILDNCEFIKPYAFSNTTIKLVYFGNKVTLVGEHSFAACERLEYILGYKDEFNTSIKSGIFILNYPYSKDNPLITYIDTENNYDWVEDNRKKRTEIKKYILCIENHSDNYIQISLSSDSSGQLKFNCDDNILTCHLTDDLETKYTGVCTCIDNKWYQFKE